jgi:DNA-binding phage protein
MSLQELTEKLWEIKGSRTFNEMAQEAGIPEVTLWRIMKEQRNPRGDTLMKILTAFPQLACVFLPPDMPSGHLDCPNGESEDQA